MVYYDHVGIIQAIKEVQYTKSINVVHHINKMKGKITGFFFKWCR